jgi:hypothetical protein
MEIVVTAAVMLTSTVFGSLEVFTRTGGFELSDVGALLARAGIAAALRVARWDDCATSELDKVTSASSVHRSVIHCLPLATRANIGETGEPSKRILTAV